MFIEDLVSVESSFDPCICLESEVVILAPDTESCASHYLRCVLGNCRWGNRHER